MSKLQSSVEILQIETGKVVEFGQATGVIKDLSDQLAVLAKQTPPDNEKIGIIKNKIAELTEALSKQKLDGANSGKDQSPKKEDAAAQPLPSQASQKNLINDIVGMQSPLIDALKKGVKDGSVQMMNEKGQPIDVENFLIPGKKMPGGGMYIMGGAILLKDNLAEIYDKFGKLGFEIKKTEKKGENNQTSYFFGINFPESYQGNKSPLTMTSEQIAEACTCLKNEQSQNIGGNKPKIPNIHSEAVGVGGRGDKTQEQMQKEMASIASFGQNNHSEFLKEILDRGPQSHHRYGLKPEAGNGYVDMLNKRKESSDIVKGH